MLLTNAFGTGLCSVCTALAMAPYVAILGNTVQYFLSSR